MRGTTIAVLLVVLAGSLTSCGPSKGPSPAAPAVAVDKTPNVVAAGGQPVLRLTLPPGSQTFTKDQTYIVVDSRGIFRFYLWPVNNAGTLDQATTHAAEIIKSEFVDFQPAETKDLTVAGAPAKQPTGAGKEADDGDPGHAVIVLFTVDGRMFAACIHGEGNPPAVQRDFMTSAIQTAQKP